MLLTFSVANTGNAIMFVSIPEVFKLFLNILHDESSTSLLVIHFYVVGFEDQFHITGSAIIKWLPALAHHPIHSHIIT